jgi:hypothetical protein
MSFFPRRKVMLSLAPGERQIDQVVAYHPQVGQGTLYLTDRRLVFEYSQGLLNKKYVHLGISLNQIQSLSVRFGRFNSQEIVISAKDANNGFKSNLIAIRIAMHANVWIGKINTMIAQGSHTFQPSQTATTATTTTIVEREVVKIPCKYCNALNDLVRSKTCSQCGAPIYK